MANSFGLRADQDFLELFVFAGRRLILLSTGTDARSEKIREDAGER